MGIICDFSVSKPVFAAHTEWVKEDSAAIFDVTYECFIVNLDLEVEGKAYFFCKIFFLKIFYELMKQIEVGNTCMLYKIQSSSHPCSPATLFPSLETI